MRKVLLTVEKICSSFLSILFIFNITLYSFQDKQSKWIEEKTSNYTIKTNCDRETVKEIRKNVEAVQVRLRTRLGYYSAALFKASIIIYASKDEFQKACQDRKLPLETPVAFYEHNTKEVMGYYISDKLIFYPVLYHEITHQILDVVFPETKIPTWFNEGMAECLSTSYWDKNDNFQTFGINGFPTIKNRLGLIKIAIKYNKEIDFKIFLKMSQKEFYDATEKYNFKEYKEPISRVGIAYAQAWSFCHFLNCYEKGKYAEIIKSVRKVLEKNINGEKLDIYTEVFEKNKKINLDEIVKEWKEYVKDLKDNDKK